MAEQEACTELVEKASQEQTGEAIEGESLLLPLLQGLLEAPENEQTADSGTESGEDQRNGLIAEVQIALDKLSASLRSDATDIAPERRVSLLQLVTKLQAGLATTTPKLERRLSSGPGRFGRRKQRQNRHTVGVSSEELADARRLMEEISLRDITPSQSQTKVTILQKQNSESSVTSNSSSFNKFGSKAPVKNATAKPFSSSNSISNNSSSVHTPTDPAESLELLFAEEPTYHDAPPVHTREKKANYAVTQSSSVGSVEGKSRTVSEANSVDSVPEIDIKSVQQAVQQAAARKKRASESAQESETEEDTSTVTAPKDTDETPPRSLLTENPVYCQPTENPIYSPPKESTECKSSYEEKCSRFNTQSKKNKMKRANTIDIPKSLNIYEDDDSECSETEDEIQRRKNNYYALRGPIRVGDPVNKNIVPVLEPKTESDQKFLSFLNKNNQNTTNKTSMWAGQSNNTPVWGNRFGNIRNNFEKSTSGASTNSARNFWKTADDAVAARTVSQFGPKISRRSARNLQQMFEEKQRLTQEKENFEEPNIVTGSLTVKTEPEKSYKFVPQPLPVNKFSHAPQSAFKPIPKKVQPKPETLTVEPATEIVKTEIKESKNDAPLFLYSPKSAYNSQNNSTATSPITSKPWVTNAAEHGGRVLNMAAKKFEVPPPQESPLIKPRKLSKDNYKVFIPQPAPPEKLTAPYLVKSAEQKNNTVRRLSGQYDSFGEKVPEYHSQSTVKYQPPQQEKQHYVPNYSIPQKISHSYDTSNTTPAYQTNTTYTQFSPTTQRQPQFPQPTVQQHIEQPQSYNSKVAQSHQTFNKPFSQAPTQQHNQFTPTKPQYSPHTQYSTQHYNHNTPSQSQGFTQNQQYQPKNYSIRYDQQPHSTPQSYQQTYKPTNNFQPVNYTIVYDKPKIIIQPKEIQNDTPQQPLQAYQHVPGKEAPAEEPEQEYTSTCQFTPQLAKAQPKAQSQPPTTANEPAVPPPKLQTQISNESVHEYTAISSKVMTGPVSQQAVTVHQKSPKSRTEHDMEAAFNLRSSLQKISKPEANTASKSPSSSFKYKSSEPAAVSPNNSFTYKANESQAQATSPNNSFKYQSSEPKPISSNNNFKYQSNEPKPKPISSNNSFKYRSSESDNVSPRNYTKYDPNDVPNPTVRPSSIRFNNSDESWTHKPALSENKTFGVVKPIQQKPSSAAPIYNNVSGRLTKSQARESLEINEKGQSVVTSKFHIPVINVNRSSDRPTNAQVLSKSDSWHQICMANQETKSSPRGSPIGGRSGVLRSKSSHTLAVPQKQFEAGMSKEELVQKKRSVEAFFCGTNKSPTPADSTKTDTKVVKRSINRIKTSEKASAFRQSSGLSRSRTLPDMICPELLDESNVDKSFDDLFKSSS